MGWGGVGDGGQIPGQGSLPPSPPTPPRKACKRSSKRYFISLNKNSYQQKHWKTRFICKYYIFCWTERGVGGELGSGVKIPWPGQLATYPTKPGIYIVIRTVIIWLLPIFFSVWEGGIEVGDKRPWPEQVATNPWKPCKHSSKIHFITLNKISLQKKHWKTHFSCKYLCFAEWEGAGGVGEGGGGGGDTVA